MTSLEREDGNIYGGEHEPSYSILSYTWGRWEKPGGPCLGIAGVNWKIPAVNERDGFSLESFRRVISEIGEATTFAWIDIACIDQDDYAIKMDEVGRQTGIFANATRVYVWLWKLPGTVLKAAIDDIVYCSGYLLPDWRHELDRDVLSVLLQLQKSVNTLLGDWWFSSLWTLQEGILRRDAMILSREGELVPYSEPESFPYVLNRFIYASLWHIRSSLEDPEYRFVDPSLKDISVSIVQSIKRAGYANAPFGGNPNIQYGAARYRQTTRVLDRIYGIISLYNIKVGATIPGADVSRPYTFDQLEDEFAAALNSMSPLLGQRFIHREKPRRTWQITQNIRVPMDLDSYSQSFRIAEGCEITATSHEYACIRGKRCAFSEFYSFWRLMTGWDGTQARKSSFDLILDDYITKEYESLPSFPESVHYSGPQGHQRSHRTATALLHEFSSEELYVLALGQGHPKYTFHKVFGLLLSHTNQDKQRCQRIGVCIWSAKIDPQSLLPEPQWVDFGGRIY